MKAFYRNNKFVKCPFWKGVTQNKKEIVCEGTSRQNEIHIVFRTESARANYEKRFCRGVESCRKCWINDTLDYNKYFENTDEKETTKD